MGDLQDSDAEGVTDEPIHVQVVRVASASSRDPRVPPGVTAAFHKVWATAGRGSWLLLDLASRRVAGTKATDFGHLYQQVAYDDIKFVDIPDGIAVASIMPDPEESFTHELRRVFFSSPPFALLSLVIFAALAAVLPELPLAKAAAFGASIL